MKRTRREVLKAGAATTLILSLPPAVAHPQAANGLSQTKEERVTMTPLDYGNSFICNTAEFNSVRFWVESRTRIFDEKQQTSTDYYQCASCKSEDTFAERDLFYKDNYDFLPILGDGQWLIFRRTVRLSERYRSISPVEKLWGTPILKVREAPNAQYLETWEQLRDATAAAVPIVTQTELTNPETGLRAIIECPVKTMNISLDKKLYQVDTGPVAYPDLSRTYDPQIDCLSLAFIAFNTNDFADFVVEQPTLVSGEDSGKTQVYHYSNPFSLEAKNRVLILEKLPEQ